LLLFAFGTAVPQDPEASAPQKYIIKLRRGAPQTKLINLLATVKPSGNKIKYTYKPEFFNGFAGEFTQEFLSQVRATYGRELEYVEKDGIAHTMAFQQPNPPSWGLSRISSRRLTTTGPFIGHDWLGRGVSVYVVDTGLQADHTDFGGRAKLDKAIVVEPTPDGNGHGTHCAGTIASKTYGVAKNAQVFGVKVLNSMGSGSWSDVISGIQYVAGKANKRVIKTIMSMSLGGPKNQAVDDAVNAAVDAGVVAIVAAGNNNGDACTLSPAGATKAFTVGATDATDSRATYSNWGKCVEIFAPGSDITSLWKGANGATNKISGTSMATPHVAGVAALYMAEKSFATVQAVYDALVKAATSSAVKNAGVGSPNKLLYSLNTPVRD